MAKMTETALRAELTTKAISALIQVLEDAGYEVTRTKDLQTLTFPVGNVKNETKDYVAYGSIKFTLHKSDFDLEDAIYNYEQTIQERETRSKELADKKAKAEADRAAKKAKREADKALKQSK